jgi:hypothetical protein
MGRRRSRSFRLVVGIPVAGLVALGSLVTVGVAVAGGAETPTADPTADGAAGSLRAAVAAATNVDGDEIDLVAGATYTLTCAGGGEISHGDTPLTIATPSGPPATIRQTCPGERVVSQGGSALLTLRNLIITGGRATGDGGGVFAGQLAVIDSTVTGNTATGFGGGVYAAHSSSRVDHSIVSGNRAGLGGGIAAPTALTVSNSTVAGNFARGNGGGIWGEVSLFTITDSTIDGNAAGTGDGGGGGGGIYSNRLLNLIGSTITNNSATGDGINFLSGFGGGIAAPLGTVRATNSTIDGNVADQGGGGMYACGFWDLVYVTVVANNGGQGAANLWCSSPVQAPTHQGLFGSVVALPRGGGTNCLNLAVTTGGFNFSDDTSCELTGETDRQNAGDPMLDALTDNGGPTQTRLPQAGSPLINSIPGAHCSDGDSRTGFAITTDQRGFPRPDDAGDPCDIGAVEVEVLAAPPRFTG